MLRPVGGQGRRRVALHQQQLAEGAQRKGIAGLQHHRFLQWPLGCFGIVIPQGRDTEGYLGVGVTGIQLHRSPQQFPGFFELHPVAVDHAQVVEALDVAWLQLQPGAKQWNRLVVATGL